MATEDSFIVAIELGSSKVTGIAGRKQPDGAIQVLATVQEPSASFIRKGRINNIVKMKTCIQKVKDTLEKSLKKSISHAYIGIGGMGMHTVTNTVLKTFADKTIVTEGIVDEIKDENQQTQTSEREILQAVIQEYKLGTQSQLEPIGIPTESIEGHFLNIVTKKEVKENIDKCINPEENGLEIAGLPITVLALADEMIPEPERQSGCVFVDMGSETTSVAIYKNNMLRHLAVIPLGGRNITADITSLSIELSEAERLKLKYGRAIYEYDEPQEPIPMEGGRTIAFSEFAGLIEAREEEIIKNVKRQIELSKLDKNQLIGGIIITGGAANMKDIEKAFTKHTGFEKIQIAQNIPTQIRSAINMQSFNHDGSYNAALAILEKGDVNCCGGSLEDGADDMFKKKAAEEAERKAKEEAERIAREKEEAEKAAAEEAERKAQEEAERIAREKREKRRGWIKNFVNKIKNAAEDIVSEDTEKKDE